MTRIRKTLPASKGQVLPEPHAALAPLWSVRPQGTPPSSQHMPARSHRNHGNVRGEPRRMERLGAPLPLPKVDESIEEWCTTPEAG